MSQYNNNYTPYNKKTLAEMFEEHYKRFPMILNDETIKILRPFFATAEADIEKRVREETLQEVAEYIEEKWYEGGDSYDLGYMKSLEEIKSLITKPNEK